MRATATATARLVVDGRGPDGGALQGRHRQLARGRGQATTSNGRCLLGVTPVLQGWMPQANHRALITGFQCVRTLAGRRGDSKVRD